MYISFTDTPAVEQTPSLAYRLGVSGRVRFATEHGIRWTYEDNEPELIVVHVAVRKRTGTLDTETDRPLYGNLVFNV